MKCVFVEFCDNNSKQFCRLQMSTNFYKIATERIYVKNKNFPKLIMYRRDIISHMSSDITFYI
jgi:hypothetical protein